jgi:regulator of protease activity HflC (stomatin/prohibitin superfamily)
MDEATNPWGIKIVRIEIRDLKMSAELQDAMNLQMTAERRRRAQVTEANGSARPRFCGRGRQAGGGAARRG